jgi:hypothetical protein
MSRAVTSRYIDPLTQVWVGAARAIGLHVARTRDAYAATDGRGTLAIASDDALDADDCLAQMIFHEVCHSLVEGERAFAVPDWGMDNTGGSDDWREHACLRAQWVLAGRHGLRGALAPTTDFRAFWDALAGDVLADRGDRSVQAAIVALSRAERPPWAPALGDALAATARIARAAARFPADASLWNATTEPPPAHPTGLAAAIDPATAATCGACAWRFDRRGTARCRQAGDARVDPSWRACERFEPAHDCQACGACCRAAYHSVEVGRRERVVAAHPELVVDRGSYVELARCGDRCAALVDKPSGSEPSGEEPVRGGCGSPTPTSPVRYRCTIYDDRPRTCRDFTVGSAHCLTARRRVGMSL